MWCVCVCEFSDSQKAKKKKTSLAKKNNFEKNIDNIIFKEAKVGLKQAIHMNRKYMTHSTKNYRFKKLSIVASKNIKLKE